MLHLVQEILLLALDDTSGSFTPLPESSLELAVAGAVLLDLELADRIDADLEQLTLLDRTELGDPVLDPALAEIAAADAPRSTREWLWHLARQPELRQTALTTLVERGVLRREDRKFLWVFGSRRYPVIDDKEEREVKDRILGIVLRNEFPDPRDVLIICLVQASGLFPSLLEVDALERAWPRIEQVSHMDLMGKQVLDELRGLRDCVHRVGWLGVGERGQPRE